MEIKIPYGKSEMKVELPENIDFTVLEPKLHEYIPSKSQLELVEEAIMNPIESEPLHLLAKGKEKVIIIASDHTRPVPSKLIIPVLLREIRRGNPNAKITIIIATGCHRETTKEELIYKFGEDIVAKENIVMHFCDTSPTTYIGQLPSGGECFINNLVVESDLVVSEGFIEPHFFAGFSGGRKSIMPGVARRSTVLANHCSEFINSPHARTGILENNPIHRDMVWAAKTAKLLFIANVIINGKKEVIHAVAGDLEKAHETGCEFSHGLCGVEAAMADIVITSNGGYPLDQNIYQAVKGMTAAETTVKKDGVIIMLAESGDGCGGDDFYHQLADEFDIEKTMQLFLSRDRLETVPDQWQSQIFIRVLQKATVIYVSATEPEIIKKLHMVPASTLVEAMDMAKKIVKDQKKRLSGKSGKLEGNESSIVNSKTEKISITVIPDGVSVIVK